MPQRKEIVGIGKNTKAPPDDDGGAFVFSRKTVTVHAAG
jgi:hypothetical protein